MKIYIKTMLLALLALPMVSQAVLLDMYNSSDLTSVFDQINTIDTAQTGAQHYDYYSWSGHPTGVNVSDLYSNIWVHQDTNNLGNYSFGFIFGQDSDSSNTNIVSIEFRIVNSDTDVFISQSDDFGFDEAIETSPGTFSGTYQYWGNTDGIMVSGITGTNWTIIIDSFEFGNITDWFLSDGADSGFFTDTALTLGEEYRFTLAGNDVFGLPLQGVNGAPETYVGVPEPATLALFGLGLAGLGFARRKKA